MQRLASIGNQRAAQAFTDYLILQRIPSELTELPATPESANQWQIWVTSEHFEQAQLLFQDFIANPTDQKYLEASWQVGKPQNDQTQSFGLLRIWRSAGGLTRFITLLCLSVFILSIFGFYGVIRNNFSFSWDLGEFYRLITPAFIHLSAMHIAFNLCFWWYLGGQVERVLGKQTLLTIVILSALMSNLAQAWLVGTNFAGLSGVNYALAGFTWYCGTFYRSQSISLPNNIFGFLVVWMLIGFADVLPVSMANWAHLFGLIAGLGLARILVKPQTPQPAK